MSDQKIKTKRNIQDSVFTNLFAEPENQLKVYQALHPEDTEATVDDITDVTLKAVMTTQLYNDLGFTMQDRTVVLMEAQSTWSLNIAVRAMMYLGKTYEEYIVRTQQNHYAEKAVRLPRPELYLLYSGDQKHTETELSLAKVHWGEENPFLDVKVRVLYEQGDDIISQYLAFTRIFKENRKEYGPTQEAVLETIRQCIDRGILAKYLTEKRAEVIDIMYHLFDDDFIREMTENSIRREAREEGLEEGREEGRVKAIADSITKLARFFRESDPALTEEAAEAKARAVLERVPSEA